MFFAIFIGIITALREFQTKLIEHNVSIYVRRAGPNYQEGLRKMREYGSTLGIPLYVFGPETHMTAICGMALGKRQIPVNTDVDFATANFLLPSGQQQQEAVKATSSNETTTVGDNKGMYWGDTLASSQFFFGTRRILRFDNWILLV